MENICLKNGSTYTGEQSTLTGSFKINMKIEDFCIKQSFVCGTFKVYNLTKEYDLISTFFEGKIVGSEYPFNETQDEIKRWARLPNFAKLYSKDCSKYNIKESSCLFLRIKELFLLPDYQITSIPGACIDGTYYVCYYKEHDCFIGYYHYANSLNACSQNIVLFNDKNRLSLTYDFA